MKWIFPRFLVNIERWKWNNEHRIFVSNTGRFKDEYKKELPVKISPQGYCTVRTYVGYYVSAHRLVMMTWRPTRDMENLTVDHLDHNKRNNTLTNLEWVSYYENQRRSHRDLITHNMNCPIGKKLTFGKKKQFFFNNYEEAAQYVINNMIAKPDRSNAQIENVAKKINNAVMCGKCYYGYKWKWVNIYE